MRVEVKAERGNEVLDLLVVFCGVREEMKKGFCGLMREKDIL